MQSTLQRRADLIPNLVRHRERATPTHEEKVFREVTEAAVEDGLNQSSARR